MLAKHPSVLALVLAGLVACTITIEAKPILVVLGDSLSDTGNLYAATNHTIPPNPLYWEGRMTNAPGVWVDYLSRDLQLQPTNFAFAGATACRLGGPIPSLQDQLLLYRAKLATDKVYRATAEKDGKFVVVVAGHNDLFAILRNPNQTLAEVQTALAGIITCLKTTVATLVADGEKVVLGTLSPISSTPYVKLLSAALPTPIPVDVLTAVVIAVLNAAIKALVSGYRAAGAPVVLWDVHDWMLPLLSNPTAFGFKYDTNCVVYAPGTGLLDGSAPTSVCKEPNDYLWYDQVHPSSEVHRLASLHLAKILVQAGLVAARPGAATGPNIDVTIQLPNLPRRMATGTGEGAGAQGGRQVGTDTPPDEPGHGVVLAPEDIQSGVVGPF